MMKNYLCILGCFLVFSSCKFNRKSGKPDDAIKRNDGLVNGLSRVLEENEVQIGKVACRALQNKIIKFKTLHLGKDFGFQNSTKSCPPIISTSDFALLNVGVSGVQLNFKVANNYSGSFFEEIITDQEFSLKYFCPKINNNSSGEILNTFDHSFNMRNKIVFKGTIEEPEVEIYYFILKDGNTYALDKKLSFEVDISKGDLEGNITSQKLQIMCSNLTDSSEITQVFIP